MPTPGSKRGPCHNCPAPRAGSSTPPADQGKAGKKRSISYSPAHIADMHWGPVRQGGGRRKPTGIRCCNLHLGCDILAPLTHHHVFVTLPVGCEAGAVLTHSCPSHSALAKGFQVFRWKPPLKFWVLLFSVGARAPRVGTGFTFPTLQPARHNTVPP